MDTKIIGTLEIIGYCATEHLIKLREKAIELNKKDDEYIYSVIRNPRGKGYGYYLIREKK